MENNKLIDVWSNFSTDGIFKRLEDVGTLPWSEAIDARTLDIHYFMIHSGLKTAGGWIRKLIEQDLTENEIKTIMSQMIYDENLERWSKLWQNWTAQYNPINNYDMIEHESFEGEKEGENANNRSGSRSSATQETDATQESGTSQESETTQDIETTSNTTTQNSEEEMSGSENKSGSRDQNISESTNNYNEESQGIYGFNSSAASPTDKNLRGENGNRIGSENEVTTENNSNSASNSKEITEEQSGSKNDSITRQNNLSKQETLNRQHNLNNSEQETETLSGTNSESHVTERELTRSGNIGVTTSAQMIQENLELWKWNFFETIMNDVDMFLTVSVYDI